MPKPSKIRKYRNGKNDPFHDEFERRRRPSKQKSVNQQIRSLHQRLDHAEKKLQEYLDAKEAREKEGRTGGIWLDQIIESYQRQIRKSQEQLNRLEW